MATLWLEFGEGFQLTAQGGLAMAQNWDETRQAIERIALTTALGVDATGNLIQPEYLEVPGFGLSARLKVGQNIASGQAAQDLANAFKSAVTVAPGVDPSNPAVVTVTELQDHEFLVSTLVYLVGGGNGKLNYLVS